MLPIPRIAWLACTLAVLALMAATSIAEDPPAPKKPAAKTARQPKDASGKKTAQQIGPEKRQLKIVASPKPAQQKNTGQRPPIRVELRRAGSGRQVPAGAKVKVLRIPKGDQREVRVLLMKVDGKAEVQLDQLKHDGIIIVVQEDEDAKKDGAAKKDSDSTSNAQQQQNTDRHTRQQTHTHTHAHTKDGEQAEKRVEVTLEFVGLDGKRYKVIRKQAGKEDVVLPKGIASQLMRILPGGKIEVEADVDVTIDDKIEATVKEKVADDDDEPSASDVMRRLEQQRKMAEQMRRRIRRQLEEIEKRVQHPNELPMYRQLQKQLKGLYERAEQSRREAVERGREARAYADRIRRSATAGQLERRLDRIEKQLDELRALVKEVLEKKDGD